MVQGIQPLLSDQVSQDLLHFPREREQRSPLHEHLQEDSQEHGSTLGGKGVCIFQVVHAEAKNYVMVQLTLRPLFPLGPGPPAPPRSPGPPWLGKNHKQ